MSKIGKQPLKIPDEVSVNIEGNAVRIKGVKGENFVPILHGVKAVLEGKELRFEIFGSGGQVRSNWGTTRAHVANAIKGVLSGFEKKLILEGIGYKITKEGNDLVMNLGFSHPVRFSSPPGISFEIEKNSILKIKGIDKALVGRVSAKIRDLKKPEPYKGSGFHYADEVIRRKAGKKAVTAGGGSAA